MQTVVPPLGLLAGLLLPLPALLPLLARVHQPHHLQPPSGAHTVKKYTILIVCLWIDLKMSLSSSLNSQKNQTSLRRLRHAVDHSLEEPTLVSPDSTGAWRCSSCPGLRPRRRSAGVGAPPPPLGLGWAAGQRGTASRGSSSAGRTGKSLSSSVPPRWNLLPETKKS